MRTNRAPRTLPPPFFPTHTQVSRPAHTVLVQQLLLVVLLVVLLLVVVVVLLLLLLLLLLLRT
jgi:hypothetical protein